MKHIKKAAKPTELDQDKSALGLAKYSFLG